MQVKWTGNSELSRGVKVSVDVFVCLDVSSVTDWQPVQRETLPLTQCMQVLVSPDPEHGERYRKCFDGCTNVKSHRKREWLPLNCYMNNWKDRKFVERVDVIWYFRGKMNLNRVLTVIIHSRYASKCCVATLAVWAWSSIIHLHTTVSQVACLEHPGEVELLPFCLCTLHFILIPLMACRKLNTTEYIYHLLHLFSYFPIWSDSFMFGGIWQAGNQTEPRLWIILWLIIDFSLMYVCLYPIFPYIHSMFPSNVKLLSNIIFNILFRSLIAIKEYRIYHTNQLILATKWVNLPPL